MKSVYNYFYPEVKQTTLIDDITKDLIKDMAEITEHAFPQIENELRIVAENARKELKAQLTDKNIKNFVGATIENMDIVYKKLLDTCQQNVVAKNGVAQAIENNKAKLQMLTADISGIEAKKKLAQNYSRLVSSKKKKIKIVGLGNSQQGKTSTLKYLFQIDDDTLKIKKNLESDTSEIKEYTVKKYGIDLIYVDAPGTSDSRGLAQDILNQKMILEYFKNNKDIDIVLWVTKIDRIVDMAQQETIEMLGKHIANIWEKTIIVMTCANSQPVPEEYYKELNDPNIDEVEQELMAWKNYTVDKTKMWRKHFRKYNDEIPVCLVENIKRYVKEVNDIYVLKDGTPFWETLMYEVFFLIEQDKQPLSFLAMMNTNVAQKDKDVFQHVRALDNVVNQIIANHGAAQSPVLAPIVTPAAVPIAAVATPVAAPTVPTPVVTPAAVPIVPTPVAVPTVPTPVVTPAAVPIVPIPIATPVAIPRKQKKSGWCTII